VVKSHGAADAYAFAQALARALEEVRNDVVARIAQRMQRAAALAASTVRADA